MTSALNLLRPSNGNKPLLYFFFMLFVCLILPSCDALKKVPREEKETKGDEQLEEIKGRRVYNPETGKWEVVTEVDSGTMDTIKWTDPGKDVPPPIKDKNIPTSNPSGVGGKKDSYNVAILLPFMTHNFQELDASINSKSELAIHLYGGMQLAFEELSAQGIKLNVSVHDTQASTTVTSTLLGNQKVAEADLIIGPISKDNIKLVAAYAKEKMKPMVSPLSPSTDVVNNNPYYIQVSPSLESHCKAITRHALENHKADQIVLVCRSKAAESDRLKFFQNAHKELKGSSTVMPFKEFIITDESVELSNTNFAPYIVPGKTTVFIIPSWSSESFVYSLMRKISIAKGKNDVVVYGMPQWMKYDQIGYDYYENLQLHISSDLDINTDDEDVKRFNRNFYNKFGTLPKDEAYIGYDVMQYFGRQLFNGGTQFQKVIDQNGEDLLHTRFAFEPKAPVGAKTEDYSKIDRLENSYVNILRFKNYHFQLVD
jgi:ABC-type branched-subunit amino acid transport system substrate-binding protein